MRTRLLILGVGLMIGIAGTLVVTHLAGGAGTRLRSEPDQFGAYVDDTVPGDSYTYAVTQVCVDGSGPVTLTDVRAHSALHEVAVVDFAVTAFQAIGHRRHQDIAAYAAGLDNVRTAPVTKQVTTLCSKAQDLRDVAVELRPSASLPAVVDQFEIDYRASGKTHTLRTGNTIVFCDGTDADREIAELDVNSVLAACPG